MARQALRSNVVDSLSTLVGRHRELAALTAFLDAGARLITILGPGGVGKTRVATRLAAQCGEAYSAHRGGGVWWIDLAGARTAATLCGRIARVLGDPIDPGGDVDATVTRLGAALARRARILLALDNCEHLEPGAVAVIGAWLARAPHAQVVATSRVPLKLAGEQRWPLIPLEVPTDATITDAVTLFLERARALRPTLALTDELPVIAEIVRRLGGLPLAIELAAARVQVLTPAEILRRLERPLELLVRPGDDGRHGSIRRTVADSLELCDAEARACFVDCAVFTARFSVTAAEAVLAAPGREVLAVLERLCAHSLVRLDRDAGRLGWLEALREVAVAALDDDPRRKAELADRHAAYFAERAAALTPRLIGAGAADARAELTRDADELLAAHAHAAAQTDPRACEQVIALTLALDPLLAVQSRLALRRRLLDAAVHAAAQLRDEDADARVRLARALCRREQADLPGVEDDLAAVEAAAAALADPVLRARVALARGELVEVAGDTVAARAAYQRALHQLDERAADTAGQVVVADAHARLGHALRREGELGAAAATIARAAATYQQLGHRDGDGAMAYEAGVIALFARDLVGARRWFERARTIAVELGHRPQIAAAASGLGILEQALGDLPGAIAHHVHAVSEFRDLGNRHREGSALYYLAGAYLELDQSIEARALLLQAAAAVDAVGAARYQALITGAQVAALALLGDTAAATAALAAAERRVAACPDEPALAATVAIHACHLRWSTDAAVVAQRVAEARALAERTPGDDPAWAARVVARRAGDRTAPGPQLRVALDGGEVRVPGADAPIDLRRRAPLRRILLALVERRLQAPGEALTQDELVAAGWPGEYISHGAASNRLHVALSTLRSLGLRPYLDSGEHGYRLAPGIAVTRA